MSSASEPTGTLTTALAHAEKLLKVDPELAAEQAREILKSAPEYDPARLILAAASRLSGDPAAALEIIVPLVIEQPNWIAAHFENAQALAAAGHGDEAINALHRTVALKPDHPEAWRLLGDHLMATGDTDGADRAYARHIRCSTRDPVLQESAAAMIRNDIATAERLLKAHLAEVPTDVPAIRMLAEVAVRVGRDEEAVNLLLRCLELAPGFAAARFNYAVLLHRHNDSPAAIAELEKLLQTEPRNPSYRNLYAVALSRTGDYERSSKIYAELLGEYAGNAKIWLSYGHVLKTEGRRAESIDAYRKSIDLDPSFGEAYWSLANLKTFRFSETDLCEMSARLEEPGLSDENRLHLHFALGKAYEDDKEYEKSFRHYERGNALHRTGHPYNADRNAVRARRLKEVFSRQLFEQHAASGCGAPDPIFIVGMPRSGSTLLEQILACHSRIEGTSELPVIASLAKDLRDEAETDEVAVHAEVLSTKSSTDLRKLGEQYLERAQIYRKTDRPFFIDKMPNNFLHIGMIRLILPNAKIIDARRHPLGCCFSNFKQYYARGQNFSYSLEDVGRFYRDYVALMAHFDDVLPGTIHRVHYERTVSETETVVRELLAYCGLEFEPDCLRFFESRRPVRTASSEQVRQPIYTQGSEQWLNYEPWLDPLKQALGGVLERYPEVPQF
jgi:tetratricopeptide (TPR) repeat protein